MSGNAYERKQDSLWDAHVKRAGLALVKLQQLFSREEWDEMRILEMRAKLKEDTGDVLVIVKAEHEGRRFVGFHGAANAAEAIAGAVDRVEKNQMKWKFDVYAGGDAE
jgi:hypothetical protein